MRLSLQLTHFIYVSNPSQGSWPVIHANDSNPSLGFAKLVIALSKIMMGMGPAIGRVPQGLGGQLSWCDHGVKS